MKTALIVSLLAVIASAFLPGIAGAAPPAHARQHKHKPTVAKASRYRLPAGRFRSRDRAFILNGSIPGSDPNLGDHMAIGRGTHPERMDHMNAATPIPTAPLPRR